MTVISDLNRIRDFSEQRQGENGSGMIQSLEEEVNQDLRIDSGTTAGQGVTSGTRANSDTAAGTAANRSKDRKAIYLRKLK